MQRKQLFNLGRCRVGIATVVCAMLAPSYQLHAQARKALPADTLSRVRQTGTVTLGYYAGARPFSYQDEAGKPAGYAVALCKEIGKNLKTELGLPTLAVEFVAVTSSDRYDALKQGKVDLLCGPSTETLARREEVDFSIPIFPGGVGALMRADAPVSIRDALAGREAPFRPLWRASIALTLQKRTFSAVTGTTTLNWLGAKRDEFKIDVKITPVESHEAGVQRVLDRSTDVLFGERSILLEAAKRNPSSGDLIVFDRLFTYEPLAFALTRGDEDFRLLVDRSLSGLYRSGAIQSLYKSSFGDIGENTLTFFRLSAVPE
jgi:ABC-type amino acid transport substrate-binding protein